MTREEIVERFKSGQMDGNDLLALPHDTNLLDVGRVLVELYYALIDVNEARMLSEEKTPVSPDRFGEVLNLARKHTDNIIAMVLTEQWFDDWFDD